MVEVEVRFDYKAENEDELSIRVGDVIVNVVQNDGGWWEGELNGRRGVFPDNFVKVKSKNMKLAASKNTTIADHNSKINGANNVAGAVEPTVTFRKEKKRRCKVLFSYKPVNEDELELEVDELIEILEEVEDGWWKGRVVAGRTGVFPSNFVKEIEPIEVDVVVPTDEKTQTQEEIKPKPVKGVGYGNIFQDGMVKLKATSGSQEPKVTSKKIPMEIQPTVVANAPLLPPKPVKEQALVLFSYDALNDDELSLKDGDIITIVTKEVEDKGWWKGELSGRVGVFPDNFVELIVTDETRTKIPDRPEKGPTLTTVKIEPDSTANGSPVTRKEKVASLPRGLSAKRLPPDVPKKDASPTEDKSDKQVPPLPCKKPNLPPPLKKAQRSSGVFSGSVLPSAPPIEKTSPPPKATAGSSPVTSKSTVVTSPIEQPRSAELDDSRKLNPSNKSDDNGGLGFDGIESSSEKLVHLTANRAKNPNRRPPSHLFHKDSDKTNGDVAHLENGDNPWMREMKRTQAAKRASQIIAESNPVRDPIIADQESEKNPIAKSVTSTRPLIDKDKDSGKIAISNKLPTSPSSFSSSKRGLQPTSPIVSKPTRFPNEDLKNTKPTSPDVAGIVLTLQEKFDARLDQLAKQYSELSEEYELHKVVTMKRIEELYGELQIEKKHRLFLQDEVQRLRDVRK